uniref:BRCA2 DNA repair associated n=1 Tax=Salarias fasciatus TaxID=181472 RepID=A0A672JEJ5_SALFA
VLTAQMSADEGSASDQEDLCANQEGNFKATLDKTDVDSQLFSTPKVFRYGRIVSPQTEDEHSFTEQGIIGWFVILFYAKCKIHSTLHHTFFSYAKHISESLGAQINPDFSWTSSLNTPPAVPSTLILCKCDAVSSVLDGAENTLSIFFANSSSALRKVRPKPIFPTKERCPSSVDVPATNSPASSKDGPADQKSPSVAASDPRLSQWSPLSLSELPASQSDSDAPHIVAKIPASGLMKKKRTFVYTVAASKPQVQSKESRSQMMNSSTGMPDSGKISTIYGVHWKKKEDEGVHIDAAAGPKLCSGLRTQLEERQAEDPRRKSLNTAQPSLHTSGFKTASNKGIHISSANLERAKLLLEEAESGKTFNSHSTKSDSAVNQQMSRSNKSGFIVSNSHQSPSLGGLEDAGCHLTESQKADVTELCTLLEEAESQFEFTQFKTAEMKQNSQGQPASAGTPDRVTSGTNKTKCGASDSPGESESVSDELKKVHPCDEGGPSSSVHVSEGRTCVISTKPLNLHRAGNTETSRNPSALGVSFKSAGGNILTVSKAGLSRARALFADLEKLTDLKSADGQVDTKQNHSMDSSVREEVTLKDKRVPRDKDAPESFNNCKTATATCQSGFHKASGKAISVSAKYIQQAHALFKDCDIPEHDSRISVKESKSSGPVAESIKKSSMMKSSLSDERTSGIGVGCNGTLIPQNPVSTSKSASSPPCWSSKSIDSSSIDGLIKADGFHTASGKKVTVSSDSLRRAEYLLKEHSAPEDTYEERSHRNPGQRSSSGLKTPGGKGVAISSTALKKAKALMRGSHDVEDNFSEKPPQRQTPIPGPPPGKGGFVSASGKPVALSSEALLKAKALFSDISLSVDVPPNSDTKTSDGKQAYMENINKTYPDLKAPVDENVQGSQFSLLKAKVDDSVSAKAMQEAGGFVKDSMDRSDRIPLKPEKNEAYLKNKSSSGLRSGQKVTVNISGEPGNGCIKAINGQMKQKAETLPRQNGGFQTASGTTLTVSSEALSKARTLLSECEEVGSEISASPPHFKVSLPGPSSRSRGFQAASGKRVSVSSESLQRARALFSDIQAVSDTRTSDKKEKSDMDGSTIEKNLSKAQSDQRGAANISEVGEKTFIEGKNKHKKQIANAFPPLGGGFQTASGKGVAVSSEALRKAETLLSEYEGLEDESMGFLPPFKAPASSLLPRNNGFLAASGKHVAVSSEALQRAKALFSDIDLSADIQAVSAPRTSDNKQDKGENTEKMHRGFTTARGEKVHVSQKSLLKAKHLLKEFDDSVCTAEMQEADCLTKDYGMDGKYNIQPENGFSEDANKQVKQKSNTLPPQSNGFQTACGKEATVSSEAPRKARNLSKSEGAEDRMGAAPPHFKLPLPGPSSRNCGFQAASGKQVSVSSEALQRARALFSDIGLSQDIQTVSDCNKQDGGEKPQMFSGFTTAGGAKGHVQVSIDRHDLLNLDRSIEKRLNHLIPGENNRSTNECTERSCCHSSPTDFYQNLQNTELARDMQDMRIRKKKRQTIRPLPGSLFLTKTSGVAKVPLKAAVNGKAPGRYTPKELYGHGVHWHVSEITSETAGSFRFNLLQFIQPDALAEGGGVQLGDGGWLIPRNDGTAGKEEFYRALCDTPGVDPKLLSEAWVFNHYRWIVWKQASMEKSFPETMGSLCLTPEQVLLQLKYRYDVEVDRSRRPALRKVLEKDDTAAKTLVLCVSGIASMGLSPNKNAKTPQGADAKLQSPPAVVWLTDGWYAIRAQLDEPLTAMLHRGRLAVGGKLIVHGAQLAGVQDACPPLEAPESAMLKISANSCRPVRWDVKLGFYKDPRPFLLPVSSLYTSGGPVGCVDILILRSYPIQWMERKPDGGVVFRSVRAEEKEARRHSSHKQRAMETLFAKIQAEFEQEEKGSRHVPSGEPQTRLQQDITALQEGEELYEAVGDDPAYLEAHLSEHQLEALRAYQHSLMEKKQRELQDRCRRALEAEDGEMKCPKRDVTPVWRLCVADSLDQRSKVYQLNLWRPSADLQSLLKEGCRYKVYNLATSEGKKRSGIEHVQLTGTKKTQFQDLQASPEWLSTRFQPRVTTSFVNLQNPDFQPVCGEVDVTGYVISVVDEQGSCPAFYLADGEVNFVKVRCFSSFSQSGLEDVVKPCVLLALSNLQLRGQSMSPTPVVYAGDLTVFSTNPKEVHLQESLSNFFQTAEEKLSLLIKSGKPQTPAPTADTMTRVSSHKPVTSLGSFTPVNRHPPAATSSSEKDPRSLKRKRALDYLSHIPSPPPLSHLSSLASPCVNKTFNPPRRSGTLSTLKTVRAPAPKATESLQEKEWVKDEELAMIDTQALHVE